jgi:nicotinamidase-related amidase
MESAAMARLTMKHPAPYSPLPSRAMRFVLLITMLLATANSTRGEEPLKLSLRGHAHVDGKDQHVERTAEWEPRQTAVIICDMWDDHWCRGAAARVVEMAPHVERLVARLRSRGVLVIHAPSTCMAPYEGTPQRRLAQEAPHVETKLPLATSTRWGTCWAWPDPQRESELPIDDTDMGCDCAEKCEIREAWTRQIEAIHIEDGDAVTDNGQELFNLFKQRDIRHVAILGVHLNMCVLGRPFGIRQMVKQGMDVCLVRDLTDTMYNHRMRPFVDHFRGNDLMVDHVERYWCPTITSNQLLGGEPFAFKR